MSELALATENPFDNMMAAVKSGDREGLMKLSGQTEEDVPKQGLARMNINYDTETDEGTSLPRGHWKVFYEGEFVYAENVKFRPLVRTYEWSVWDQDEGKFSSRSVQAPSLDFAFPDTTGGNKCGRLTKSEEEQLGEDHPKTLASRLATCNQVFYALVTMDGKNAEGKKVAIKDLPVVAYFKRSGFRPAREAIEKLGKTALMSEVVFELSTKRNKMGSVTYYTPVFTKSGDAKMDEPTMETMAMFLEGIKASNNNIMEQHREAVKAKANDEDIDLAADFN
jgi:hypothetical protein